MEHHQCRHHPDGPGCSSRSRVRRARRPVFPSLEWPPLTDRCASRVPKAQNFLAAFGACGAFKATMTAVNLPIVGATPTEVIEVDALAPTFERFYEANSRRLFAALCLVTGNRDERRGDSAGGTRPRVRTVGAGGRARRSDRLPVPRVDERFPRAVPAGVARGSPRAVGYIRPVMLNTARLVASSKCLLQTWPWRRRDPRTPRR